VRVKEFKDKSAYLQKLVSKGDVEKSEALAEEVRKDEKKLAVSFNDQGNYSKTRKSVIRGFPFTFELGRRPLDREEDEEQEDY
jgi:hypothetical protein